VPARPVIGPTLSGSNDYGMRELINILLSEEKGTSLFFIDAHRR
jgi:hypothetical protein